MKGPGSHPSDLLLSLLAGDDLGALRRFRVRRHVEACEMCAATVAEFRSLRDELSDSAAVPDIDFKALEHQIRATARAEGILARPAGRRWKVPAAAAAFAASLLLALFTGGPVGETVRPAAAPGGIANGALIENLTLPGSEAQITADGRLSVQAFHAASGTLTITDYYLP